MSRIKWLALKIAISAIVILEMPLKDVKLLSLIQG